MFDHYYANLIILSGAVLLFMVSMVSEYYATLISRGESFITEGMAKRLTFRRWRKDFENQIGFEHTPYLYDRYQKTFERMDNAVDEYERGLRLTALLLLIDDNFDSVELPLGETGSPFISKNYSFLYVPEYSAWDIGNWKEKFGDPDGVYLEPGEENPWTLHRDLGNEYSQLFYGRVRELLKSTDEKSPAIEVVKRDKSLRDLINETRWYDSRGLRNAFYYSVDEFCESISENPDPAARFVSSALLEIFKNQEFDADISEQMLASYWGHLADVVKSAEGKRLLELTQIGVTATIRDLKSEIEDLRKQLRD